MLNIFLFAHFFGVKLNLFGGSFMVKLFLYILLAWKPSLDIWEARGIV
jgi:hypothetical protein